MRATTPRSWPRAWTSSWKRRCTRRWTAPTQLLNENREKLDRIARELINREKLDKEEFAALMRGEELPPLDGGKNPIESILNA